MHQKKTYSIRFFWPLNVVLFFSLACVCMCVLNPLTSIPIILFFFLVFLYIYIYVHYFTVRYTWHIYLILSIYSRKIETEAEKKREGRQGRHLLDLPRLFSQFCYTTSTRQLYSAASLFCGGCRTALRGKRHTHTRSRIRIHSPSLRNLCFLTLTSFITTIVKDHLLALLILFWKRKRAVTFFSLCVCAGFVLHLSLCFSFVFFLLFCRITHTVSTHI